MITKSNSSAETIKAILDAAFLDSEIYPDGDIGIDARYRILLSCDGSSLSMSSIFTAEDGVTELQMLQCVNNSNATYRVPRAYTISNGERRIVVFDLVIFIGEGISPKTFVEAIRTLEAAIQTSATEFKDLLR